MGQQERLERDREARLREQMQQARATFDLAKIAFESETAEAYEIGLDRPNGAQLLHRATGCYISAVLVYRDAVKSYADWLLRAR